MIFIHRRFNKTLNDDVTFRNYMAIVIAFFVFTAVVFFYEVSSPKATGPLIIIVFFIYLGILLLDIMFLVLAAIFMLKTSQQLQYSQQLRFDIEKKWYWNYLELCAIMTITLTVEIISANQRFGYYQIILLDIIKLFSILCLFGIFVGRKNVRNLFFNKYRALT